MVTVEEMMAAKGHRAIVKTKYAKERECFIENFIQSEDEDEEPMILYTPSLAAEQSDIESIEIID